MKQPKRVTKIDFGIPVTEEEMKILKEAADIPDADTAQTDEADTEGEIDLKAVALRQRGVRIPITQKEMRILKKAAAAQTDEADEDEEEKEAAYPFCG